MKILHVVASTTSTPENQISDHELQPTARHSNPTPPNDAHQPSYFIKPEFTGLNTYYVIHTIGGFPHSTSSLVSPQHSILIVMAPRAASTPRASLGSDTKGRKKTPKITHVSRPESLQNP